MRIVMMNFVSLDGVYQGPGSADEDRSDGFDRGGWLVPFVDSAFEAQATKWTASATGFLFGRRTYEAFSSIWPTVRDPADHSAARLNTLQKFVVASQPVDTAWGPVTVLGDNPVSRLQSMKAQSDGELQIHGSGSLGRSFLALGLVDELRLVTAPVVVGQGRKLFEGIDQPLGFSLRAQERTPAGLTMSTFVLTGAAVTGEYKRGETNYRAA